MATAGEKPGKKKDFFVSYTGADRAWAEWIAWELEAKGYSVIIQAWDFHGGDNFIKNMHEALEATDWTIAVLSAAYLKSVFAEDEWTAAFVDRAVVPVRIEDLDPPGLFKPIAFIDFFDTSEREARKRLLDGVSRERAKPKTVAFPGRTAPEKPRFPGALPAIWNVPHRNPHFTGREALISDLRGKLTAGTAAAVTQSQAITGLGGIGKSELAMEYAYRFKDEYALVWWVRAEERATLIADVIALARDLDLPEKDEAQQDVVLDAVRRWLDTNSGWLLIYDNVPDEQSIEDFVPRGATGHAIITSRDTRWGRIASPLAVDLWNRDESLAFLRERTGERDEGKANRLADLLGDLPLALEQAAAYVKQTQKPLVWYADQLETGHGAKLWAKGRDAEKTVAATWTLSFERVAAESPAGAALLRLCAFLAPDDIPLDVIRAGAEHLPEPLKTADKDDIDFEDAVGAVLRYSLARRDGENLSVHRLVQAVTRNDLAQQRQTWAERAANLIDDALPQWPHDAFDTEIATVYDRLLPHAVLAAEHAEAENVTPQSAAMIFGNIGFYQELRAELVGARTNCERSCSIAEHAYGPEHPIISKAVNNLGLVLKEMGALEEAREHFERALTISRKASWPDLPGIEIQIGIVYNNFGLSARRTGEP